MFVFFFKETKRIFKLYTIVHGKFIQDFSETNSRMRLSLVDFFVKSGGGKSNHLMRDYQDFPPFSTAVR